MELNKDSTNENSKGKLAGLCDQRIRWTQMYKTIIVFVDDTQ